MHHAIAIIMAKGHSKRFNGPKNTHDVCGKPLLAYPIATAKSARCFDEVIVSTDSQIVAEIAREHGADDVVMREKGWDEAATCEYSVEQSIAKHQNDTKTTYNYCGILGGDSIFIRPSWFRAARTLIDFYRYQGGNIGVVVPDKQFVTLAFCKINPEGWCGSGKEFMFQHRGIICDINTPSDLEVARQIQSSVKRGAIDYAMQESVHEDMIKHRDGFRMDQIEPTFKEPFNAKQEYYNAANKWGSHGPPASAYLE